MCRDPIATTPLIGPNSQLVRQYQSVWSKGPRRNDVGASRSHILDAVDASLRRLQTDYIDHTESIPEDAVDVPPLNATARSLAALTSSAVSTPTATNKAPRSK